ncbi:MAG: hypothetical protein FJ395_06080 [Verrucomicrobia bacterium]|nr:hypothetical protein [Verrucomicrobiota bacterium]
MSQGLCPSCGAVANLTGEQNQINCTYCGSVVTLQEAEAKLEEQKGFKFAGTLILAQTSQEGGSYAEALSFWNKLLEQEPTFVDAWIEKGVCMVSLSKIGDLKITEAVSSWKAAIKFAKNKDAVKKRVALEINNVVARFYPHLENHYIRFRNVENSLSEHYDRFCVLEGAQSLALELNPSSPTIAKNGIDLCDEFVKSIKSAASSDGMDALSSALDKDWKGALENATRSTAKQDTANEIEKGLLTIKLKYMRALEQINKTTGSSSASEIQKIQSKISAVESAAKKHKKAKNEAKLAEAVEAEAQNTFAGKATNTGCLGMFGLCCIFVAIVAPGILIVHPIYGKEGSDVCGWAAIILAFVVWRYLRRQIRKRAKAKLEQHN